jgi:stage II sporulation protein D
LLPPLGTLLLAAGCLHAPAVSPGPAAPPAHAAAQPQPAQPPLPEGLLRVGLRRLSGGGAIALKPLGAAQVLDLDTGKAVAKVPAGRALRAAADYGSGMVRLETPSGPISRRHLAVSAGLVQVGQSRRYPGRVELRLGGTGLQLANVVDIEQYLEGVLPGELPAGFGMEAQKALAVAARSYALVQRGKHGEFDLCDGTCCQMYLGRDRRSTRGLAAVRTTRRQVLRSGEDLVYAFYSADCGGLSARVEDVPLRDKPEGALPYLTIVRDGPGSGPLFCGRSPYHRWSRRFTAAEIEARLNGEPATEVGRLRELAITGWDDSGRVTTVRLLGEAQPSMAMAGFAPVAEVVEKTVTGWTLRNVLGPLRLKSTRMRLDRPQPDVYRFQGQGFGHGLGLCQIGANGMAARGVDYRRILAHYYPGTRIERLP